VVGGGASDDRRRLRMQLVGAVRLRETGAKIAPGLVDEPGRPPAGFWDACIAVANVLRACTAL
jgi:hypothetical protein